MKLSEIARELGKLLCNRTFYGEVEFSRDEYDESEIPIIIIGGKTYKVSTFAISNDGSEVIITTFREDDKVWWEYLFYTDFIYDTDHEFADNEEDYERVLESMGVRELFNKVRNSISNE